MLRKYINFYIVVLISVFAACGNSVTAQKKGAFIEVNDTVIHVGVLHKDTVKHEYLVLISNIGDQPLEIKDVVSSCFCAEAVKPKNPIAPGDTYPMKVILDTSKMSLQEYFIREFRILSNAINRKEITVSLNGSIIK